MPLLASGGKGLTFVKEVLEPLVYTHTHTHTHSHPEEAALQLEEWKMEQN